MAKTRKETVVKGIQKRSPDAHVAVGRLFGSFLVWSLVVLLTLHLAPATLLLICCLPIIVSRLFTPRLSVVTMLFFLLLSLLFILVKKIIIAETMSVSFYYFFIVSVGKIMLDKS